LAWASLRPIRADVHLTYTGSAGATNAAYGPEASGCSVGACGSPLGRVT